MMDRAMLQRLWEKWASPYISPSGDKALTGAALINFSTERPSRFFSLIVQQEALSLTPSQVHPIIEAVNNNRLHSDYFYIGSEKYLVTTVFERTYCARLLGPEDFLEGGCIIGCTIPYVIISTYLGSISAACKAVSVVEDILDQLVQQACS